MEWAQALCAVRGRLEVGGERGQQVHAASFIRARRIVFDQALRDASGEMNRILVHELFHFAWVRLSNGSRQAWRQLLVQELARRARGELGWSAESRKRTLQSAGAGPTGSAWNDYSCESFCDSAAWIYASAGAHEEFTLARRFREIRRAWFRAMESHRAGTIRI